MRRIVVVLAAVPLAAGLGCMLYTPAPAPVELTFLGPDDCASAEPDEVVVWREKVKGKPHQVEWQVVGGGEYRWVLTRAAEDAKKAGGDHFPSRQIRCGTDSVRSGRPMNLPAEGQVTWSYQVEVYECSPNPRPEAICVLDPTVIIKDQH